MATQSNTPSANLTTESPQLSASEITQATGEDVQDAKASPTPSVFVNTEPMREDQVQNAVNFLSHPKVRGSPVIYRRSFLERKGLTKEEIDEAFRRVPDPPPTATSAPPDNINQGKISVLSGIFNSCTVNYGQLALTNALPQAPTKVLQPPAAASGAGAISTVGTARSRFHWYHTLLAVGVLAVSGAGTALLFKNALVPRLKSWIRKVVLEEDELAKKLNSKPSLTEETAAAAKAAAAAASDVAKASQEMVNSKNEEKMYFMEFMNMLDAQQREMKSLSNSIRKLEGQSKGLGRNSFVEQEDYRGAVYTSSKPVTNGKADFDVGPVRSSSSPASAEQPPHPKSYMEAIFSPTGKAPCGNIMAMVQRGERPPNIKDINDLPPNPNQPLSNPRMAPRAKPWETAPAQNMYGSDMKAQDTGVTYEMNGDNPAPWWQRKNVKITEIEQDETKSAPYSMPANDRPIQRTWVPPQPPPVAMPAAAAAIRQPKSSIQRDQLTDDQLLARASDGTDELQRITKISESGGSLEMNGGSSGQDSSEIQQERENGYEEH
ncbi:Peroxisome membrane anchor protein Pex14p, N-terminal [Dillenia turbinata]|uniref:Peroxisomal membrane protein PEX14 n=1 Tax=Dillenia turbinata TaxID=194707 RepID=A0AAN8V3G9_9MAGN